MDGVGRAERRQRAGTEEMLRAQMMLRQSRYDAAIPLLRRAWELGNFRNAQWNLAECYALLSRPRRAIEAHREYLGHRLTTPSDRAAATAAIERLANDRSLRQSLGAAGRTRMRNEFSIDAMVDRHVALYESILDA